VPYSREEGVSVQLREYQKETIVKALDHEGRLLIANDMGTGKTLCAIAIARMLKVTRVLVVAPLAVASVWKRELAAYWPDAFYCDAIEGTIADRAEGVLLDGDMMEKDGWMPFFVVTGYESYWRDPLRKVLRNFKFDLIIFDEGHRIKSRTAKTSRFAHALAQEVPHRLVLSATPMTKGPEDLFSLFKVINPEVFGTRYQEFEWEYLIKGGWQGKQVVGYRNREKLEGLLHEWSTRITKEEALDLPEEQPVEIAVPMGDKARGIYNRLVESAISEVTSLKGETGTALSRVVITNILRLKQITSGFIKLEDDRVVDIDDSKLKVLRGLLEDMPQRVVVFAHFRRDIDRIREDLEDKRDVWVLDGRTKPSQRADNIEEWEHSTGGVLVCQIAVSSLGIDLTAASTAIYYSVDYNLTSWIQCHGRLHRHGQTNKVTNYYLITERSIDRKVYRSLANKEDLTKSILDLSAARDMLTVDSDLES